MMIALNNRFTRMSDEELNNLIYVLIKYTYCKTFKDLKSPPNDLIHRIMLDVCEDPNYENIIHAIINIVYLEFKIKFHYTETPRVKFHMYSIIKQFNSLPLEKRENLGSDKDDEEFKTKH